MSLTVVKGLQSEIFVPITPPAVWTPVTKELKDMSIALATAAGVHTKSQERFNLAGDWTWRKIENTTPSSDLMVSHGGYDNSDVNKDINCMFPIDRIHELAKEGFIVMPYMYPDLTAARDLASAGAACVMPLAAPIGTNKGLCTKEFIRILIEEIDLPVIVDAGIGRPSQACEAMEMGCTAVMANTAIATAGDIPEMAEAFRLAIEAGRRAYLAHPGRVLEREASASSPLTGFLRD